MRRLLMISFDAIGDDMYDRLLSRSPRFAQLVTQSRVHRDVSSVFLTNTYPVHTCIATGLTPKYHGVVSNTHPFPSRHPPWCYEASLIKAKTLWQAAAEKGLATAAVMWPVTGGAREIRYNIPELMVQPGENQILMNMKYGSKLLQAHMFLKYGKILAGVNVKQPEVDNFATACMAYVLRKKAPALALMHLTAYDFACHGYGLDSPLLETAFEYMDKNLGILLDAADGRYDILLFSDHSQLPTPNQMLPNGLLAERGFIRVDENGDYLPGDCFFECCGGSAFLHPGGLHTEQIEELKEAVQALPGFERTLSATEMDICGRAQLPFGFAVKPGWGCEAYTGIEQANHGYPIDYDRYKVFYLCRGEGFTPGLIQGGNLLEVTAHAASVLDLNMDRGRDI